VVEPEARTRERPVSAIGCRDPANASSAVRWASRSTHGCRLSVSIQSCRESRPRPSWSGTVSDQVRRIPGIAGFCRAFGYAVSGCRSDRSVVHTRSTISVKTALPAVQADREHPDGRLAPRSVRLDPSEVIQPSVMDRGGRTGTLLALHRVSGPRPVGRSSGINSERSGEARRIDPTPSRVGNEGTPMSVLRLRDTTSSAGAFSGPR
jgi:hypothetical protein